LFDLISEWDTIGPFPLILNPNVELMKVLNSHTVRKTLYLPHIITWWMNCWKRYLPIQIAIFKWND